MTKEENLLRGLDLATASGIEIGALDKPVVPPSSPGIFYVDYADTATLRHNYRNDPNVDVAKIVNVSGIWGEKTLAEIAAPVTPVDFVVASHVIEHVPDLITWLQELASVLKPDGEVRLAIPDRRFTFDVLRAETGYADVLSAWLARARVPQARAVIDHVINFTHVDCAALWEGSVDLDSLVPCNPLLAGELIGRDVLDNGTYHDVHCWVFTPRSFADLMFKLADAGHLRFKCGDFLDTGHNTLEFFATLQRCDDRAQIVASWKSVRDSLGRDDDGQDQALARLRQEVERALVERDTSAAHGAELETTLAGLRRDIAELRQSSSWRFTSPLRSVVTWLRR